MKTLIIDKVVRVIKARAKLEKKLNVKISNRGKEVTIQGTPEDEYTAEKVLDALDIGFPFSAALLLKEEDFVLEVLNIKNYTKRNDMKSVRARIIGKHGKALSTLSNLTGCDFEIKDNRVGIIGPPRNIENAQDAIIAIIKGAKHSNVYKFLERHQVRKEEDLGLKEN